MRPINPTTIRAPFSNYSHAILVPEGHRLVFCSGQLGIDAESQVSPDCDGQARQCFANIEAVLAEAGMGFEHIVRINAFVTGREHMAAYMDVRNELIPAPYPASTLMIVSGFSRPEFVVEVEVIAAAQTAD